MSLCPTHPPAHSVILRKMHTALASLKVQILWLLPLLAPRGLVETWAPDWEDTGNGRTPGPSAKLSRGPAAASLAAHRLGPGSDDRLPLQVEAPCRLGLGAPPAPSWTPSWAGSRPSSRTLCSARVSRFDGGFARFSVENLR